MFNKTKKTTATVFAAFTNDLKEVQEAATKEASVAGKAIDNITSMLIGDNK